MDKFIKNCRALLEKITIQYDANWIAFSGGLDSSILGQIKKDQDLNALTIIAKDFIGTDLSYSQIIGKHIGIPLELKYVSIDEMLDAIKGTIKILKNFNDIEIRNSIVSYIYLNALKKKNITKIITGDGADEIFAGYNFLVKKDHDELQKELKRMKKIMHFTSQKIANELGISVQMPFIDESIIKFVETLPVNLLENQNYGIKFGKWILRKAFENDLPSSVISFNKVRFTPAPTSSNKTNFASTIIVLPSSSSFFCPPDKFPASSFARCLRFKNSITSKAFCFTCSSSFLIKAGLSKAFTRLSPD